MTSEKKNYNFVTIKVDVKMLEVSPSDGIAGAWNNIFSRQSRKQMLEE